MFSTTNNDYGDDGVDDGDGDGVNLAPRVRLILKETSWEAAGEAVRPSGEVFLGIPIIIMILSHDNTGEDDDDNFHCQKQEKS